MQTDINILPSGVELEFCAFNGEDKEEITKGTKGMVSILMRKIVRVGNKTDIDSKFIKQMLIEDQKAALLFIRAFTFDYPEKFVFAYNFAKMKGEPETEAFFEFDTNFPITEYAFCENARREKKIPYPQPVFESYEEISEFRKFIVTLPNAKKTIEMALPDLLVQEKFGKIKEEDMTLLSKIKFYSPKEIKKTDEGREIAIDVNLKALSLKDIDVLETEIANQEANIDVNLVLDHPILDYQKTISIFTLPDFFSQAQKTTKKLRVAVGRI